MPPIRIVVADDERLGRQKLKTFAAAHSDLSVVAECTDGTETLKAIRKHRPDLVLLDIRMPGMDGFEVLRQLRRDELPHVVFVTAHGEYAIDAFRVEAVDYLLKPFDRERFDEAIDRVRRDREARGDASVRARLLAALDRLEQTPASREPSSLTHFVIRSRGKITFIDRREVNWIGAEGKYVRLHTSAGSWLLRQSIGELERRLERRDFLRIHRSTIVNIRRVKEIHEGVGDDFVVLLHDGTTLSLSRRYRARLRDFLG